MAFPTTHTRIMGFAPRRGRNTRNVIERHMMLTPAIPPNVVDNVNIVQPPLDRVIINRNAYLFNRVIGEGGNGIVYHATREWDGKEFAVKVTDCTHASAARVIHDENSWFNEVVLLESFLNVPHIIQIIDYDSCTPGGSDQLCHADCKLYIVFELAESTLSQFVEKHAIDAEKNNFVPPNPMLIGPLVDDLITLKYIWKSCVSAVHQMHHLGVIHRDIKPDNFVVIHGEVTLIDMGMAVQFAPGQLMAPNVLFGGTAVYVPPEIAGPAQDYVDVHGSVEGFHHDLYPACDIWALGIMLISWLRRRPNFSSFKDIVDFSPSLWIEQVGIVDEALIDIILRCLDRDPQTRITADEILSHPFLTNCQTGVAIVR